MRPLIRRLAWALYATAIAAWFAAGVPLVPFHGDESIWIRMSRDFEAVFVDRDLASQVYNALPADSEEQSFRELNSPLAKYVIGLSRRTAGYREGDLNGFWEWDFDWDWNARNGRLPDDGLLHASRWLPALLAGASVLAVALVGALLDGPATGVMAGLLLAMDPAYLLHTRRAMAEGVLMTCAILSVALVIGYLARLGYAERPGLRERVAWLGGIGVLVGLTVAAKLNGGIIAITIAVALLIGHGSASRPPARLRLRAWRATTEVAAVAAVSTAVVLALSPYLWPNPVERTAGMLHDMNVVVQQQARRHELLATADARVRALLTEVFTAPPAYYEDAEWGRWLAGPIARYEASPLSGWQAPAAARTGLAIAFAVGLVCLSVRRRRDPAAVVARQVLLTWLAVTVLLTLLAIPLGWQRYYLLLWPEVALVQAAGLATMARWARARLAA